MDQFPTVGHLTCAVKRCIKNPLEATRGVRANPLEPPLPTGLTTKPQNCQNWVVGTSSRSVYFCAIPSSSPVQNELSLTTPNFCFGTSISKSKSGSYISLFVLELSLPNRKEKADLPQFVLEQIEKPRTFRFGTCPPNWIHNSIRNLVLKSKRPTSLLHKSLSNPNRNPEQKFCFQVGYSCHEGLRFDNLKLDRFSPGWRSQGQWAWCGRGIEVSTIQRRLEASI